MAFTIVPVSPRVFVEVERGLGTRVEYGEQQIGDRHVARGIIVRDVCIDAFTGRVDALLVAISGPTLLDTLLNFIVGS